MSTDVLVVDEPELRAAIAAVRSDALEEDWCMAHHNGKPNEIKVRGSSHWSGSEFESPLTSNGNPWSTD